MVASALAGLLLMNLEIAEVTMDDRNLGNGLPSKTGAYATVRLIALMAVASLSRHRSYRDVGRNSTQMFRQR